MSDIRLRTRTYASEDRSWLGSAHGTEATQSITLDLTKFTSYIHYPNGYLPSGLVLGKITASGLYGPYNGTTDEIQTVTEGGSGLTSFTLTYSGQTTASIPAAATAAQVQAAISALSNVGAGNVAVQGNAGGVYSVYFTGTLADTDVAQMTSTPTGGSGTVTVATGTAGGTAGQGTGGLATAVGHLWNSEFITTFPTGEAVATNAILLHGQVIASKLPAGNGLDSAAKTALAGQFIYR